MRGRCCAAGALPLCRTASRDARERAFDASIISPAADAAASADLRCYMFTLSSFSAITLARRHAMPPTLIPLISAIR